MGIQLDALRVSLAEVVKVNAGKLILRHIQAHDIGVVAFAAVVVCSFDLEPVSIRKSLE
jgi:hypothetical protein